MQLLTIWRLLNVVGAAVFDDISTTARLTAAAECEALGVRLTSHWCAMGDAQARDASGGAQADASATRGKQAELRALAQAEADRSQTSIAGAEQLKADMLKAETEQADIVVRRLVHQSMTMLSLLDAICAEDDLIPADEPPEDIHHGVKKKLRMETREMALDSSSDQPQEGRGMVHPWNGLPLGELTPENAVKMLDDQSKISPPPGLQRVRKQPSRRGWWSRRS